MIIRISESTRADKKWMAKADGKTVHFGQKGSSDFTISKDAALRDAYIARHGAKEDWSRKGVMTPGFLSRWLLWEKPTMSAALASASTKYNDVSFRWG